MKIGEYMLRWRETPSEMQSLTNTLFISVIVAFITILSTIVVYKALLIPNKSALDWAKAGAITIAIITLYSTLWRNRSDSIRYRLDKKLEHINELYDEAYRLILTEDKKVSKSRRRWIAVAGMLHDAQELSLTVSDQEVKKLVIARTEIWRIKFGDRLNFLYEDASKTKFTPEFFYEEGNILGVSSTKRDPICEIAVDSIIKFMAWPKGKVEQLEGAKTLSLDSLRRHGVSHKSPYYKFKESSHKAIMTDEFGE